MPSALAGARQVVERRVALAQSDRVAKTVENGQQFAEAPDAGVVQRLRGAAALAPEPFERAGIGPVMALSLAPAGILHFKEVAALGAAKVGLGLGARRCAPRIRNSVTDADCRSSLVLAYQRRRELCWTEEIGNADAETDSSPLLLGLLCLSPAPGANAAARGCRSRPGARPAADP